jgi:hypothetical protein
MKWFLKSEGEVDEGRYFPSLKDFEWWLKTQQVNWRVGYLFRLHGADFDCELVNKRGNAPKTYPRMFEPI